MKIVSIDTIPITAHIDESIMISSSLGAHRISRYLILQIHTDEGIDGLGEATVAPRWSGETSLGTKTLIDDYLAPAIIGENPFNVERLMQKLDEAAFGNPFAKAAVEMAILDIIGKKLNTPLCDLIGGHAHDSVDEIPVKFVVAAVASEIAVRNALAMVASGFSTIKIKVGRNPQADIERVRGVREAVGPAVHLTIDANGGWTVADAVYAINRMEGLNLTLAEQPVPREDTDGLATVRRKVGVPIMADESVFTVKEALDVIRKEAADIISVYPGKNGGILKAQTISKMAEAAGIACHIGSNLELEIGSAAMAHLAVATANVRSDRYPADIIGPLYHKDSVTAQPFYVKAGIARLPEGPGLGVELDEAKVARLRE